MTHTDRPIRGYVAVGLIVALGVVVVFLVMRPAAITQVSAVQNGQFTQVGLASLSSPFYSDYAITAAVLNSGSTKYVNGSAVYDSAINATIYGGTNLLGTIVFQLSGTVGGLQLTPSAVFNDSSLINSSVFEISGVSIYTYTGNQEVFIAASPTIGSPINVPSLGAGQYALEVSTHFSGKVLMPTTAKVIGVFKLDGQLTGTTSTGATSFSGYDFNVKS